MRSRNRAARQRLKTIWFCILVLVLAAPVVAPFLTVLVQRPYR
jgi:hypothetical protein